MNFEKSFERLEQILDKMNSGNISLDESLKLYEEADKLITGCSVKLGEAEEKIETLIKARNSELALKDNGEPQTQPFEASLS